MKHPQSRVQIIYATDYGSNHCIERSGEIEPSYDILAFSCGNMLENNRIVYTVMFWRYNILTNYC